MIEMYAHFAMGVLHWPPSEFWNASICDVKMAMDGYMKANGFNRNSMTAQDVSDLKQFAIASKRQDLIKNGNG